ncbi:hypothetical protein PR001_g3581 [Phytophthora rubi]|nr:hypothetical protein PR002_g5129 [Phytophthora rubi]KAE9049097.1 hypothetical protein PR001_g3581 [Phytophthora rubi]
MIMCSQDPAAVYNGEIDVLLLFSKCIKSSTLTTVETWAIDMQTFVEDTVGPYDDVALTFKATMVAGSCSTDGFTTVLSFTTDKTSYGEIMSFESVNHVVNFQLSGSGENCEGGFESYIELKGDEDLFMYNPFTGSAARILRTASGAHWSAMMVPANASVAFLQATK